MSTSSDRVAQRTPPEINERIRRQTEWRVRAAAAEPGLIEERLEELDREWDMERTLFTATAVNVLLSLLFASTVSRKWLVWTAAVAGFQLQHGTDGWCPPVSLFRRLGVRTQREIARERAALRALRGDYRGLPERPGRDDAALVLRTVEEPAPAPQRMTSSSPSSSM